DPGEEFHDVTYSDEPVRRGAASDGASDITAAVREIITRKTTRWEYESEIRCLKKRAEAGGEFVGKISGVYFGSPYGGVSNRTQVIGASEVLREYYQLRHCLEVAAVSRGLECFEAYLSHGHKGAEVRIAELPRSKCPTNPSGDPNLTDEVQ
ncbi:MAG TPA: hypothetical protein VGE67_02445, partial [Haloferula sp.]